MMDAGSKSIEADYIKDTSTLATLRQLFKWFPSFGFPRVIHSDNVPQFTNAHSSQNCLNENINGVKGAVRVMKSQLRDKDGKPIIYENDITVHSPRKYMRVEDVIETFKEFGEVMALLKNAVIKKEDLNAR
ncbi:unnamed protein product [Lepeophtheirus salmonis]|uniref:(salmon louse) hypothetical protein n=1 Tax=Lepeophtheirus salmonis TaxID=72036 RepID=A0A7R8CB14_LEPSM|nr:unnamed protein product [Lepeophtheirus salmonis]CAF2752119.1 unnamed protein product [Lepeophtheirus salmonis]